MARSRGRQIRLRLLFRASQNDSQGEVMASQRLVRLILTGTAMLAGATAQAQSAKVDMQRLLNADKEAGQWMTHSRTFDEQYFSPLKQIDEKNVDKLGLAWFVDLP